MYINSAQLAKEFSLNSYQSDSATKVRLENGWNCKQMITEGDAAIPLETTLHALRNQEKTKQRSTIAIGTYFCKY